MAPIYLVSDIHAGDPAGEAGRRDFLDFLCFLENQKGELFILGDLFDFWFEWRHVVPKGVFDILYQLRRLVDAGWRVVFLPGNHDFAPGAFLSQEVGIELPGESMVLEVEDKRYFLSHGDGLAARDRGYRVLKKILHSPLSQWLFRHFLHPDWGMGLARLSSHGSRRYRRIDREAWAKDYLEAARRYFLNGFDGVVLGHVHEPVMLREGDRVYANCGDWLEHRSCIVGEAGKLCIADWDPQRKHLQKRSPDVE
ncbi:MAG: UDP-2,3-diacylglucosamine diphosphatase [Candidatus Aminicenantes bacterium]|nr:UDP-2,3-diacylglucosamine diphosphatase [Candidatus Aminicenantes bacterium]